MEAGAQRRGRRGCRIGILVGLVLHMGVSAAWAAEASSADEALRETVERLERRVEELEDEAEGRQRRLDEAEARLEANERRERNDTAETASRLDRLFDFVETLEYRLALATSYNWNFNNPDSDPSFGFPTANGRRNNGSTFPNVQHNTFQLDQIDLAVGRPATDENRAGFQIEILYGVTADPQEGSDVPQVQQAYAEYRSPLPGDITFRLGRWDTPIGAEVIYVGENFNITRGLAWFYQTVHHDGLLISGDLDHGFSWKLGVANNGRALNFDNNNGKSAIAQIGWLSEDERVRARATYLLEEGPLIGHFSALGSDSNEDFSHFLDLYLEWDPTDDLALWFNLDWVHTDFEGQDDTETFLLAIAGRLQVHPRVGYSVRAEGALFLSGDAAIPTEGAVWLTNTLDFELTRQLSWRNELLVQHSFADTPADILFINGSGSAFSRNTQVIAITQLLFVF